MIKLRKGKWKFVKGTNKTFWVKAWYYWVNRINMGYVYKQNYPKGEDTITIYRFTLHLVITNAYWKKIPKKKRGYLSCHYKTKKEAQVAMKEAIHKQLNYIIKTQ